MDISIERSIGELTAEMRIARASLTRVEVTLEQVVAWQNRHEGVNSAAAAEQRRRTDWALVRATLGAGVFATAMSSLVGFGARLFGH